ncbi:MAG: SEC-C metal-binding domain-containing protein, partial [bacterium]
RQLRGRSGRQGDPGSSRFYLSLEDDLMRLFGSDRLSGVISKLGIREDEPIQHSLISKQIGRAQKRVEGNNFAVRKHLLEYDDVMNKQREVIYARRLVALESEDMSAEVRGMIEAAVDRHVEERLAGGDQPDEWDLAGLKQELETLFVWRFDFGEDLGPGTRAGEIADIAGATALAAYEAKQKEVGYEAIKSIERGLLLYVIDRRWRDHLYDLDGVRAGIGLRAYGQKDPLIEYKSEAYQLFVKMLDSIDEETVSLIFHGRFVRPEEERPRAQPAMRAFKPDAAQRPAAPPPVQGPMPGAAPVSRGGRPKMAPSGRKPQVVEAKVGRNDPCPCGSGKKYKKCCGK